MGSIKNNLQLINILVTGANGQLAHSIKDLADKFTAYQFVFVSKQELDITELSKVKKLFKNYNFNYCINCAAYTNVEQAEQTPEPAFLINAEAVKNLAQVCKEYNATLLHISTDYVFDGEKGEPYVATDIPNPINQYGKSKLKGEQHIQEILEQYYIVRTSWLYNKNYGKNFYRTILEKTKKEKPLILRMSKSVALLIQNTWLNF